MRKMKSQIFLIIVSIMIVSCKKEYPTQVQMGNLVGFVTLYDENDNLILNKSGVNITVNGSSTYKDTTDNNGRFEIDNIPSGIYNIIYSKQGFSETKTIGMQFAGGSNPAFITKVLTKPASTTTELLKLSIDTSDINISTWIVATLGIKSNVPIGYLQSVRFYFGLSDSVSYSNYDYTSLNGIYKLNNITDTTTQIQGFEVTRVNGYYKSGTKVYFIAYGATSNYSSYIDLNTGKTIIPGLNPLASKRMSIIIP